MRLVQQILAALQDTGLRPDGSHFLVAWPREGIVNRGFRIHLDSDANKWAAMLADSEDCATFAYIHNTFLEASSSFTCRGPNPEWQGRLNLLETAVLSHASSVKSELGARAGLFLP
jgi:hypothetical protein